MDFVGLAQTTNKTYWQHFVFFRAVFVLLLCLPHAFIWCGPVFVLLIINFFDNQQATFSRLDKFENNFWIGAKVASAPETSQQAWVMVRMRLVQNVYGYLIVSVKKSYLSSWVFTTMQSVHTWMNLSLSPPLKNPGSAYVWIRLCMSVAYNFGCRSLYNLSWRASASSHQVQYNILTFEALLRKNMYLFLERSQKV